MLRKLTVNSVLNGTVLLMIVFTSFSCVDVKKATYFQDLPEGNIASNTPLPESIIQKNDILGITISSLSPEASAMFNTVNPGVAGGTPAPDAANGGYLVSTEGTIQFPLLGAIKVEGLTKNQLKDKIVGIITEKKLLVDPIVSIRFMNFRVTVLGEVNRPNVLAVPNEKISLLEAIGLAGDMTLYAKRDNVLVIREENNTKTIKRLNLNSTELFSSPYYYLKSNDIVYVEPNKARVAATGRSTQILPVVFGAISLATVVATLVIQLNNN